jgi:hypothetical protein
VLVLSERSIADVCHRSRWGASSAAIDSGLPQEDPVRVSSAALAAGFFV